MPGKKTPGKIGCRPASKALGGKEKHMKSTKSFFSLLLCACLLLGFCALASAEQAQLPLSLEELQGFNKAILDKAIAQNLPVIKTDEGFVAAGTGFEVTLDQELLSADATVLSAAITMDGLDTDLVKGPRGSDLQQKALELIKLFPNDNATLAGTMDGAVLYMQGEWPANLSQGILTRDGQNIQLIEYSVMFKEGEGAGLGGVQYTIRDGLVTAIRTFTQEKPLSLAEMQEMQANWRHLQEQTGYFSYNTQEPGPLEREDLMINGLDFLDASNADYEKTFGKPLFEDTVKDSNGESLKTCQWEALEAVFRLDAKGNFVRTERVSVLDIQTEGPRGLRIGDTLADVIARFKHPADLADGTTILYGDAQNQQAPYGLLVPHSDSTNLYYAVRVLNANVTLNLVFMEGRLVQMSLSYL